MTAPEPKAGEFDRAFDAGEDVSGHVDWAQARRIDLEARRVNVDFPAWVVEALDRKATGRPGCTAFRGSRSSSCGSPNG